MVTPQLQAKPKGAHAKPVAAPRETRADEVTAVPSDLHYAPSALQRVPDAARSTAPVQGVWNFDDHDGWWEESDEHYIYDPQTHEWQWGDEDEGLDWAALEVNHALARQALLMRMSHDQLVDYMDGERANLPGNHEIAEVGDALPGWEPADSDSEGEVVEDENISVMADEGSAVPVGIDFRDHAYTGSFGANTCVIVLMRATNGVRHYGGSIHLTTTDLESVVDASLALISLYEAVGAAMGGEQHIQGLPVCYAIGGENGPEADDISEYATLYSAFETVRSIMTLRGAVLPASGPGGGINASITHNAVRFDRGAQLKRDPNATEQQAPVIQGWFWNRRPQYASVEGLKRNIAAAIRRGAGLYGATIASAKNIDTLLKLFTDPTQGEMGLDIHLRSVAGFAPWVQAVLQRIEQGAQHLSSDIAYWLASYEEGTELDGIALTGSELHERGLGVAMAEWSFDYGPPAGPKVWNTVLKPDDRRFEQALLGGDDSIAGELNRAAGLRSSRVQTLDMDVSVGHGSMVEYVGSGLGRAVQWGLRKLGVLHSPQQATIESMAFAFLTGLHDLHQENVKYRGGAPVLIDAEVGAQHEVIDSQYTARSTVNNSGFNHQRTSETAIQDQLAGRARQSQLLTWAQQNPATLAGILKRRIGDTRTRIVPVYTGRWFTLKNRYLSEAFYPERGAEARAVLAEGTREIPDGGAVPGQDGLGLKRQIGDDQGANFAPATVAGNIQQCFDEASIPEFYYQPSTGRVFFRGGVIWRGIDIDGAMLRLRARLRGA